ncbi:hypothetical protein CTEN210_07913 [Chaetoceros tenuissimus]|uniref:CW-type domain-containing protein n=1 Tax=Chaetoceros tenuissimus TaxID=426638 RepID=A0AAD3H5K3_9STRA|nr:hypothetical protein CTEN210_07913 [Chaetoceros tenuissimus]
MTNENKKIPYIPFDYPLQFHELDIPIPDWLENEIEKVDLPDIASPTSASDATESSTTTASSSASPNDSNSSSSFDASTASPTSASDASESSTTTASSSASPNDSIPNSSTSNEPEQETFLYFGRKMTWEQIQNLNNNPKVREQFEKSLQIYLEMKHSPSSTFFFFESKRRKQCRKVPVPELDNESILLYEPIAAHMRSQNLFENELVLEHFKDPIYVMFVNWFFEVLGFIGTPPLLFGNTDLSLADFIGILRLTFSVTKVQDYQKHHTFVEFMKLVESLALTTGANIAWVAQNGDPFGKRGDFASLFSDKILESDPGLKELVDLYKKVVELYQKCALPISIRIIKNRIQKNKVSGNNERKDTENIGEKGVTFFMVDAQSGKYLKYFPDCCKQASEIFMHSFKNGNAFMKMIKSYHYSVQNNGYDGEADGLMTLGLFHRAYFVYLSILSIIHRQDFNETFVNENGKFDFKKLLKKSGVAGVKGRKPALMSKDTDICYREVASNTIESCSLEMFVRETGISYEELYSEFANPFTYKRDVQELRGYDVSLNRSSLEKYNTFRGVSEMKSGKFKCELYLQEEKFYLGTHPSEFIAAYIHDRAVELSGIQNVTLNFESQEDNEETLDVVIKAELDRKQESMSKEDWAKFDQKRFIEEYTESIPSDAVIKGVVVGGLSWTDSLKGITIATKKLKKTTEFIGVYKNKKKFQCTITHNGTYFHLGNHSSEFIAACVYDKAATLLGRKKLNFKSDEDFKEKLQVVTTAELLKKKESMSKEAWAEFDQKRFIEEYTESIPSDAVIKGVVVGGISWTDSLKNGASTGGTVVTKKVKKTKENGASTGGTVVTKKVKKTKEFIGVHKKDKGFKCEITHNGTIFYLGCHSSEFIAACVYDKAATLLGRKKLNFKSDEDFKEKLQVVTTAELLKKKESMSKEAWAEFDQKRFIEEYTESIPSDAVIKGVVVDQKPWAVVKKAERERKSRKHKLSSVDGPIEEKKSKKRQKDKDLLGHKKKEEEEEQQEWVQCEKCEKWHRLPRHIAAKDLPDKWFCSMNDWDPQSVSCTVQEDYKVEDEKIDDNAIVSTSKEEEEEQQEWVQCEKCEKWHRLPRHIAAKDLPDKWFCSMNDWDPQSVSCTVQEDYKVEDEKIDDNAIVSTSKEEEEEQQ